MIKCWCTFLLYQVIFLIGCSWNSVFFRLLIHFYFSVNVLFRKGANSTPVNDQMLKLVYLGVISSLNFLPFLAVSGEVLLAAHFCSVEPVFCESHGSSSLIISLLSYSELLATLVTANTCGCAEPCELPMAAAADDIWRCFWKCFSTSLKAVVLKLKGLLKPQISGLRLHRVIQCEIQPDNLHIWQVSRCC